jgi:signal transduction histidine kinase
MTRAAVPSAPAAGPAAEAGQPPALRRIARRGAQVVVANALVAVAIVVTHGGRFGAMLVYAEAIGLACWAVIEAGRAVLPPDPHHTWPRGAWTPALLLFACVAGYALGTTVAGALLGESTWPDLAARPRALLGDLAMTAIFGGLVVGWFFMRGRAETHAAQVAAAAHEATLARLTLLQSQLEPHMLFNTLANLRALIASDPARAEALLDRLIDFLRATLAASRASSHPLADEFARLADYLALMQVRTGGRLRTTLDLPPELARVPVPPLLLQPLVENAIRHGLEPQRGPGELVVTAATEAGMLVLAVADTGRGLEAAAAARAPGEPRGGFGLTQVRERLQTLHGDAARFTLEPRPGGGTRAEIRLPLQ